MTVPEPEAMVEAAPLEIRPVNEDGATLSAIADSDAAHCLLNPVRKDWVVAPGWTGYSGDCRAVTAIRVDVSAGQLAKRSPPGMCRNARRAECA